MLLFALSALAADPWLGTYTLDDDAVRFVQGGEGRFVEVVLEGNVVMRGPLIGTSTLRTAPLDSCGGSFSLEAGDLMVEFDGPECPTTMNGLYQRTTTSHCKADEKAVLSCDAVQKGAKKRLEVCQSPTGLSYRFGPLGKPELVLEQGVFAERPLVSGIEKTWTFANAGYTYRAFEVESSRAEDNASGVVVAQGDRDLATLTCQR